MNSITLTDRFYYLASAFFNIHPDNAAWLDAHELQWEDDNDEWLNRIPNKLFFRTQNVYHVLDRLLLLLIYRFILLFCTEDRLPTLIRQYEAGRQKVVSKIKRYKGFYSHRSPYREPDEDPEDEQRAATILRRRILKLKAYFSNDEERNEPKVRRMYRGKALGDF